MFPYTTNICVPNLWQSHISTLLSVINSAGCIMDMVYHPPFYCLFSLHYICFPCMISMLFSHRPSVVCLMFVSDPLCITHASPVSVINPSSVLHLSVIHPCVHCLLSVSQINFKLNLFLRLACAIKICCCDPHVNKWKWIERIYITSASWECGN